MSSDTLTTDLVSAPATTIKEMLAELKTAREALAETEMYMRQFEASWKEKPTYRQLVADKEKLRNAIDNLSAAIQTMAVDEYRMTSNKHPVDGVQIKVFKEYQVDQADALKWAMVNFPAAVKQIVDEKLLVKVLDQMTDKELPAWATRTESPKAQIASKL